MFSNTLKIFNSFSIRLYFIYFFMVGGSAWFIVSQSLKALDKSVNQAAEEILVDSANLLAQFVESQSQQQDVPNTKLLKEVMPVYLERPLNAKIYERTKTNPNLHVYVTNAKGIVIFDSTNQSIGEDFNKWRDVRITLAGNYGARSSAIDFFVKQAEKEEDKGLFVSAPIIINNKIIGVLTVIKNKKDLGNYILSSTAQIKLYALGILIFSLLAGGFLSWWLWRSIKTLSNYARQLGKGHQIEQPKIIHSEFKPLADAVSIMHKNLEGKEYVENYIHTMAHELKSPLTGIMATMELLQQDLPELDRQKFYNNIQESSERMQNLITCLLKLAMIENQKKIDKQSVDLTQVIEKCMHLKKTQLKQKNISIHKEIPNAISVQAEPTLLDQILSNLIDNAIDFCEKNAQINIRIQEIQTRNSNYRLILKIIDTGIGLSTKDNHRIFEQFYSTPRPDTFKRSSGLGLSFVKQAVELHGGQIEIKNNTSKGVIAKIYLP